MMDLKNRRRRKTGVFGINQNYFYLQIQTHSHSHTQTTINLWSLNIIQLTTQRTKDLSANAATYKGKEIRYISPKTNRDPT